MSLIRWSPMWDPFAEMDEVMNRLPAVNQPMRAFVPAMNMYENDQGIVVETALPGINPENVKVSVEKGVLVVQGASSKEHEVEEKNYYRKEVRSGAFYREVALPAPVAEDAVEATFEDGMLKIVCPKAEPVKSKKVEVKIVKNIKK